MSEHDQSDLGSLPVGDVGAWVEDKHARLRRYVAISAKVRAKFDGVNGSGSTYIDLYCGPGRLRDRDTGNFYDGSALVAAKAAQESGHPFREVHIADTDAASVRATGTRLRALSESVNVYEYIGPASATSIEVARKIDPYGLHLAFLDPFNLTDIPFSVIESLAPLRRMDLLVHVSAMDLQRNWRHAMARQDSARFEAFAPGWREAVGGTTSPTKMPLAILQHWLGLVRGVGFNVHGDQLELVTGPQNQRLYWLALAAKHERAQEFWDKIRHINPQRELGL